MGILGKIFPRLCEYMKTLRALCTKCLVLIVLTPAVSGGSYLGYLQTSGNFHYIVSGEAYRSGQLSYDEFVHYLSKYDIKTVLNLRGKNTGSDWYEGEVAATKSLHVTLIDYGISANKEVPETDVDALMRIIRDAPKPILIHCKGGADRSGLMAALYLYSLGRTAEESSGQLSVTYGHIAFWNSTKAMDRTFWRYVAAHEQERVVQRYPSDVGAVATTQALVRSGLY
jgi:protein tyrosine/serine phosphatase